MLDKLVTFQEVFLDPQTSNLSRLYDYIEMDLSPLKRNINIRVIRNSAFEPIGNFLSLYLKGEKIDATIDYGPYDESFSIRGEDITYDFTIIYFDTIHHKLPKSEILSLIEDCYNNSSRVDRFSPSLVLVTDDADLHNSSKNILNSIITIPKVENENLTTFGTSLHRSLFLPVARYLVSKRILPWLLPPIKMIALDLDNTLHQGVIGEDGIDGVHVTKEHIELQKKVLDLKQRGALISIISKNELEDIVQLMSSKYLLKPEDCFDINSGWDHKSNRIEELAKKANIATESILFVDDNPLEVLDVLEMTNPPYVLFANKDPMQNGDRILQHPALVLLDPENQIDRSSDLRANTDRLKLANETKSTKNYEAELKIELKISWNQDFSRASEMSRKTNQFNMALQRYTFENWSELKKNGHDLVQVSYSDRFSDSGVILSIMCFLTDNGEAEITEMLLSCRALGRNVEDLILSTAINEIKSKYEAHALFIWSRIGPRNGPARKWLQSNAILKEKVPDSDFERWKVT